jgi:large subunit ribosomal protein L24
LKPTTKPTTQRKRFFQAPDHKRHKLFGAPLSPELRKSHGVKTLPVRSGDTVRIVRGDHKGVEGKITRIDSRSYRIYVEGLTREKVDGTAIFVPIHPSKVTITNLNLDDKWRKEILKRKERAAKKEKRVTEKPPKAVAIAKEEILEEKVPAEEKPKEKKPRTKKKTTIKKPATKKTEKERVETKEEETPKAKKPKPRRKPAKKTEGGV